MWSRFRSNVMLGTGVLPAIVLFVVLSLIYTYIGGVKAVIWTDAVQFGLFLLGGLFALFYIPTLVDGGFSGVLSQAAQNGQVALAQSGIRAGCALQHLDGRHRRRRAGVVPHGAEQLIVQRVLACKNVAEGRKALVLSAALVFPLFLIFLFVGDALGFTRDTCSKSRCQKRNPASKPTTLSSRFS